MQFLRHVDNAVIVNFFGLKISLATAKFWDSTPGPYGYYDLLKEYAGSEYWFSGITVQHGWAPADIPDANDVLNAKSLMLCQSRRDRDNFIKKSPVRCEIAGAPFVHYRRRHAIEIAPDAKGTVAFPAHSVPGLYAEFDLDRYCDELLALPEKFQPVTVCLHPSDIMTYKIDKRYHARGFQTVSAGVGTDLPFCPAFYEILRKHRYSTSNEPGSYTFYAVEMGIPFFILGETAQRDNTVTRNIDAPQGVYSIADLKHGQIAFEIFSDRDYDVISAEQRDYVISELGVEDCLSPAELNQALWDVAKKQHYVPNMFKFLGAALRAALKYPLTCHKLPRFYWNLWRYCHRPAETIHCGQVGTS